MSEGRMRRSYLEEGWGRRQKEEGVEWNGRNAG